MSMVLDYGRTTWPLYPQVPTSLHPAPIDSSIWYEYKKLLEDAKEFDKKAKQPDCEDPEKQKWFETMDERMKRIEDKLDKLTKDGDPII